MKRSMVLLITTLCASGAAGQFVKKPILPPNLEPLVLELLQVTHAEKRGVARLRAALRRRLDRDELQRMIDFYRTPLGQKMVDRDSQFHLWELIRTVEFFSDRIRTSRQQIEREATLRTNPARVAAGDMRMVPTGSSIRMTRRGEQNRASIRHLASTSFSKTGRSCSIRRVRRTRDADQRSFSSTTNGQWSDGPRRITSLPANSHCASHRM